MYSGHKWMTIHGNGTFISPGILVIDWKVLRAPTGLKMLIIDGIQVLLNLVIFNIVSDRLVFTIIGADPSSWVVGFMCDNNNPKRTIVF